MEWFVWVVQGAPVPMPVDVALGHAAAVVAVLAAALPLALAVRESLRTRETPVQGPRLRAIEGGRELRQDVAA